VRGAWRVEREARACDQGRAAWDNGYKVICRRAQKIANADPYCNA
jgi:hypothetical protein